MGNAKTLCFKFTLEFKKQTLYAYMQIILFIVKKSVNIHASGVLLQQHRLSFIARISQVYVSRDPWVTGSSVARDIILRPCHATYVTMLIFKGYKTRVTIVLL